MQYNSEMTVATRLLETAPPLRRRAQTAAWALALLLSGVVANQPAHASAAEPESAAVRFLLAWGKEGREPGEFHFPIGIAITPADEVFVTDHYNNRVQKFDRDGKLLTHFSVLPNPGGIAIDQTGRVVLSHFPASSKTKEVTPDRLTVYDAQGKLLHEWGATGTGPGEFNWPGGLGISRDGRLYVADQTNHRIQVLDTGGRFLAEWGRHGTKPGEFGGNSNPKSRAAGPNFVAFDREGNAYVTEGMDGRVQKFTPDGVFLLAFGGLEDRPGSFGRDFEAFGKMRGPIAICSDRDDRLWISSAGGRIQQFSNEGRFLRGFGEQQGSEPGQFLAPHGVALDSRGHLYVVDAYNHRIQKFDVASP